MKRSLIHLLLAAFFTTVLTGYSQTDLEYIRYTVKANEDPRDIALAHLNNASTGLDIIMQANPNIASPNAIKPGDTLIIPKGIEKVESMELLAIAKIEEANGMFAATYAPDAYKQSLDFYKAALKEHQDGNFEFAIRKAKLAGVWAERALETARKKATVDLEVILAAKNGIVQNSTDGGKSWKVLGTLHRSPAGSLIRTGKGSSAHLEFPDSSVYELMESTTIELVELTKNLAKDSRRTSIALHDGEYIGRVKKVKNARHDNINLNASGLAILIRGTTVRVTKKGNLSTLAVTDGKTQTMSPGNELVNIDNGQGIKALEQNGVFNLQVVNLPAAPQVDQKFANFQVENPKPGLNWDAVANAQTYRFELSERKDFASMMEQRETPALNVVPQNELKPGVYFWRVTARSQGLLGYTTPVQRLQILEGLAFNILIQQPMKNVAGVPVSGPNNKIQVQPVGPNNGVAGFEYSWNGSAYQTMINGLPVPQTSGVHIFHARSFAANGRRSQVSTTKFRVDADAPTVTHTPEYRGNIMSVRFNAKDDAGVKTLELREADGSITPLPNNSLKEINTKHGGSYTLRAVDTLGNASAFKTYRYSPGFSPGR